MYPAKPTGAYPSVVVQPAPVASPPSPPPPPPALLLPPPAPLPPPPPPPAPLAPLVVPFPVLRHAAAHGGGHYGYAFFCPGCNEPHVIPTKPHAQGWDFNGNEASPTFEPSILVHEVKRADGSVFSPRCHSRVIDGRIHYEGDCGHALAGQVVPMVDVNKEVA